MLFLQRKESESAFFFVRIFIGVCIGHLSLVVALFLLYRPDVISLTLSTGQERCVPIMMVSSPRPPIVSAQKRHTLQPNKKEHVVAVQKKDASSQKAMRKNKVVAQTKINEVNKKINKQTPKKQIPAVPVQKEQQPKLAIQKPALQEIKQEIKQVQPQKIIESKQKSEPLPVEQNKDVGSLVIDVSESMSNIDAKLAEQIVALQQEIAQTWSPPIGVDAECWCRVQVIVGLDGIIKQLAIQESSGVLIYEMTIRQALMNAQLPAWIRGKTLIITFKQSHGEV